MSAQSTGARCRAVFLDAGGVVVLPDRDLLAGALRAVGIDIDPAIVPRAHYRAVRALDRAANRPPGREDYARALLPQLGIVPGRTAAAIAAWQRLADRSRSGAVLWSEPTPGALTTIAALRRRGLAVVIVTNSDGHAEENLARVRVRRHTGDRLGGRRRGQARQSASSRPRSPAPARSLPRSAGPASRSSRPRSCTSVTRWPMTWPARAPPASPRSTSTRSALAGRATTATSARSPGSGATWRPPAPTQTIAAKPTLDDPAQLECPESHAVGGGPAHSR